MSRRYIARNPDLPFADALLIDDKTLYISGRIGFLPGTRQLPDDIDAEATYLMQDLQAILAAAGMTLDDLATLTIYCPDVALWEQFNAVYRSFFTGPLPPAPSSALALCSSAPTSSYRASPSNPERAPNPPALLSSP
jgi:2-iminobutanoate/2-iminopropanoate deaminase